MKHRMPTIKRVLDIEVDGSTASLSPEWIDEMILIGRLYVGSMKDHLSVCREITAEREAQRLIARVRAKAAFGAPLR
jgi:hypothetical protein